MPRLLTTEEALAVWSETHAKHLAPRTIEEYRSSYRLVPKGRPTLPELAAWQADLLRRYAVPHVNHVTAVLRAVAGKAAAAEGDLELGATIAQLAPLREPEPLPRCPPLDLVERAIELAENPAEVTWFRLAGDCGLRVSELLGLQPEHVDHATSAIRVVRQRRRENRKNYRPHAVELDADLMTGIRWTIANRETIVLPGGEALLDAGWLFPWSTKALRKLRDRLRAALPGYLPKGTAWHGFRHVGATRLALEGASVIDIQRWLGDRDPSMAIRYVASVRGATRAQCLTRAPRPCQRVEQVGPERVAPRPGPQPSCHSTFAGALLEWEAKPAECSYENTPVRPPGRRR